MSKKIRESLDLVPFQEPARSEAEQIDDDFEFARTNTQDLLGKIGEAITKLADVADQSQHPRAYEVLDKLFNTALGANKDLMTLRKQKIDIEKKEGGVPEKQEVHNTQNNLYITTAELNKLLDDKKKDG